MRKYIFIFVVYMIMIFNQTVYADDLNKSEDKTIVLEKYDLVTKHENIRNIDFIISIMKSIGANENSSKRLENIKPVLHSWFNDEVCGVSKNGYVRLAKQGGIIRGSVFDHTSPAYFIPSDYVTYKNAMLFMMRCLDEYEYPEDESEIINNALQKGLFKKDDKFLININAQISKDDYYELIYRFINMKGYLYYNEFVPVKFSEFDGTLKEYKAYKENMPNIESGFVKDTEKKITYIEYLEQINDQN